MGKRNLSIFNLALVVFGFTLSLKTVYASPIIKSDIVPCPITLDRLSFVGQQFIGQQLMGSPGHWPDPRADNYFCVSASDDTTAISKCGGDTTYSALNPGNPQYGLGWTGGNNDLTHNSRGFYFCIPKSYSNSKSRMCDNANSLRDAGQVNAGGHLNFNYRIVSGQRNGNCVCNTIASGGNPAGPEQLDCSTEEGRSAALAAAPNATPQNTDATTDATTTTATATSADFTNCVDQAKASAARCKNLATSAQHDCNPSNVRANDTASAMSGAAGTMANLYTQMNAGTGSQSSCFTAGLLSNAARMAAVQANDSCHANVQACTQTCGEDEGAKYEEFRQCAAKLTKADGQQYSPEELETGTTPEARYYQAAMQQVHDDYEQGRETCQRDGVQKQDLISSMLNGVGNALASSLRCACQLSSSATVSTATTTTGATQGGCNASNIPTAQDCTLNPSLSGCQVYSELSVCTPGSSYNAALCRCQTNPSADGCGTVATSGTVASMAGSAIQAGGYAGANGFTIPPSSGSANNLDLSGGSDSSGIGLQAKNPGGVAGSRQPYVGGGGSGGDSGGGRGGVPNGATAMGAGKDDNGILGGLMNAIKTGARTLGFSRDQKNGNYRDGRNGNKGSGSGFRPRGLAGNNSGMGGKHMEIWTMMNRCMQAETCPSNTGQFILTP